MLYCCCCALVRSIACASARLLLRMWLADAVRSAVCASVLCVWRAATYRRSWALAGRTVSEYMLKDIVSLTTVQDDGLPNGFVIRRQQREKTNDSL